MMDVHMNYLNPDSEIHKSRGELPHWQQGGVLQFVSFRLGDALPLSLMREWKEEREKADGNSKAVVQGN